MWACLCECGRQSIVRGAHLRKGNIKTCGGKGKGCQRIERADITGKRFGALTVIRRNGVIYYSGNKVQKWECKCDCGIIKTISRICLSRVKSCGCLAREATRIRSTKHGMHGTPEYWLLHHAKRRARLAGYESNLELSDITIPKNCPLLGVPLLKSKRAISENSPTIDRVNPNGGYMKGNVWVVSQRANRMKSNMTVGDMKHFISIIEKLP